MLYFSQQDLVLVEALLKAFVLVALFFDFNLLLVELVERLVEEQAGHLQLHAQLTDMLAHVITLLLQKTLALLFFLHLVPQLVYLLEQLIPLNLVWTDIHEGGSFLGIWIPVEPFERFESSCILHILYLRLDLSLK